MFYNLAATRRDMDGAKAEYLKQLDGNIIFLILRMEITFRVSNKCFNRCCSSEARFVEHEGKL